MGKGSGKKKGSGGNEEVKNEHPLQAVLLADSFTEELRPVTLQKPKVLLPMAGGIPMLEYTLEFLAQARVEEIFVFACWLPEQIIAYLENSRWKNSTMPRIKTIISKSVTNAGEALRELDNSGIIRSDPFVLVSGDVVANLRLAPIIALHKERKKKDPDCVMTMIFKRVSPENDRLSRLEDDLVVAMNKETQQIVKYENSVSDDAISFPDPLIFNEHPKIEIRRDLRDCHIDICSPKMLLEIAGNYDYQDLRKDYVHNEVQNQDLGYKIFGYELSNPTDYAAQVRCWRTYAAVSRDIIRRWLYPLVLEYNWAFSNEANYVYSQAFVYKDRSVSIDRSASIGSDCVIGADTEIGGGTSLVNTTVGRNCKIGSGVTIEGAVIWDNVVIGNDVTLTRSVVCDNVRIGAGCVVPRGVTLSFGVEIEAGHRVPEFSRLTIAEPEDDGFSDDFGDLGKEGESELQGPMKDSPKHVGANGKGYLYTRVADDTDEQPENTKFIVNDGYVPLWAAPVVEGMPGEALFQACRSSLGIDELEEAKQQRWLGFEEIQSDNEDEDGEDRDADADFLKGISEILYSESAKAAGKMDSDTLESLVLEVNCFKYAEDRPTADSIYGMLPVVFERIEDSSVDTTEKVAKAAKELVDCWLVTLMKVATDTEAQFAILDALELVFLYGTKTAARAGLELKNGKPNIELTPTQPFFRAAFPSALFNLMVVDDEELELPVEEWLAARKERAFPPMDLLDRPDTKQLIEQFLESDDESASE